MLSTASQDQSEMDILFIHSELDDYGLQPTRFRVYCHLARRASKGSKMAFPGVRSMANICAMTQGTVVDSILDLERAGIVVVERKSGCTTHYKLTKKSEWKTNPKIDFKIHRNPGGKKKDTTAPFKLTDRSIQANATAPFKLTKGNPTKEIQKGNPVLSTKCENFQTSSVDLLPCGKQGTEDVLSTPKNIQRITVLNPGHGKVQKGAGAGATPAARSLTKMLGTGGVEIISELLDSIEVNARMAPIS